MSRVGNKPIDIPSGVKVAVADGSLTAEGPKGKVQQALLIGFPVKVNGSVITVERPGDSGPDRAKHGLLRALLANAVSCWAIAYFIILYPLTLWAARLEARVDQ